MSEHVLIIGNDFVDDTWTGECTCGWEGEDRNAEADAIEDWENHCEQERIARQIKAARAARVQRIKEELGRG